MQVVIVEPKKKPMVKNIDDGLEAMQKIVGGTIQAIYPFEEPIGFTGSGLTISDFFAKTFLTGQRVLKKE